MPKRTKRELETIKNFLDSTYNRFGNLLLANTEKVYDPQNSELGYCYKYTDAVTKNVVYKIECAKIGIDETDFRILMHEYGHIYLGHLDGIHEELDVQICNVFRDHRGELIETINRSCGIDFADKLIERVIDDPVLNHSLHNIAMDMEVNSTVLSEEDVKEMERDISSIFPKTEEELLKYMIGTSKDPNVKSQLEDALQKMQNEAKVKLILPNRYYLGPKHNLFGKPIQLVENGQPVVDEEGNPVYEQEPFPSNLTYPEYLILIIKHLDQFVKMLVSIKMGGNGDTSKVTQQDIQNVLNNMAKNWAKTSSDYRKGYQDALNDYRNGKLGNKQNSPENQQVGNQPGMQQPGQEGQQDQQGQQMPGNGQPGNNGNQGQQGQGNAQSEYDRGYQDALNDIAANQGNGGNGQGMQSLSDLMNQMGMGGQGGAGGQGSEQGQGQGQGSGNGQGQNGSGQEGQKNGPGAYQGQRFDPNAQNYSKDHRTESRDAADTKRDKGQIKSGGGAGCGNSGGPDSLRDVDKNVDEVDMALGEVMRNMRSRVIKYDTTKDVMRLYNRGIVRSVIAPTVSRKVTLSNEEKIVYLIDISGSMDERLIDRVLGTIARNMKKLSHGLKYDIITWSTSLGEHIRDIDPKRGVPKISSGGGTSIASGIKYFKDNYGKNATLIIISDFEDYLEEWHSVEKTMTGYNIYGFNYGRDGGYYSRSGRKENSLEWTNLKERKFKNY